MMDYGKMCYTGFATVSKNVKHELKQHFGNRLQLDICAINHFGDNYTEPDGTIVFSAKNNDFKQDDFGRNGFMKILNDSDDYDGIFIIADLGIVCPITNILRSILQNKIENNRKRFKSVWYFAADCKLFPALLKDMEFFDSLVTMTEFGRNEIIRLRPDLKNKLSVSFHGTNTKDFHPLSAESKKEAREFFGRNADKFIITNVNRNQPRKDLPNTIFAFIEAKRLWTASRQPFLYLHCHPADPKGHNLRSILMQTELIDGVDYMLLPKRFEKDMATVSQLNALYNASDLFVTTTLGEGWGLSITEAFATKLPVICPPTTSMLEISGGGKRATLTSLIIPFVSPTDNVIREQTDYAEMGELIVSTANAIMEEDKLLKEKTEAAYNWAQQHTWKDECKNWIEIFKKY